LLSRVVDVLRTRRPADPALVGRTIVLNSEPYEVIGVLRPRDIVLRQVALRAD
jgi:hypothetical protein